MGHLSRTVGPTAVKMMVTTDGVLEAEDGQQRGKEPKPGWNVPAVTRRDLRCLCWWHWSITAGNRQGQLRVSGEPSGSLRRASERSESRTRRVRATAPWTRDDSGRGPGEQEVEMRCRKQMQKEWGRTRCGEGKWGTYKMLCLLTWVTAFKVLAGKSLVFVPYLCY